MASKNIILASGIEMPVIGLGTWQLTGSAVRNAVHHALKIGYRLIDTADVYENHKDVGGAIQKSGVPRRDIFITTKVWRTDLLYISVRTVIERYLSELGLDYIDQLLIHWPNKKIAVEETAHALKESQTKGYVRSVGVSNFTNRHIEKIEKTGITIDVNQIEYHYSFNQKKQQNDCEKKNIKIVAYSPLGQGEDIKNAPEVINEIAEKYSRTVPQILLNWLLVKGVVVIPRSCSRTHISENIMSSDFVMNMDDFERIESTAMNSNRMINPRFSEF